MNRRDLGSFIMELREGCGMERKELAKLLGVSVAAICQYENSGSIKTERLYQIAEIFGITLDELLEFKRAGFTTEEMLEEKYSLKDFDLHRLLAEDDSKRMTEYFRRLKAIRNRFYSLMIKTVFHKRSTKEELRELGYLCQFFENGNDGGLLCAMVALFEQEKYSEQKARWVLEKNYPFKREYFWDLSDKANEESYGDIKEFIFECVAASWDDYYYECFEALVEAMSKIERDVCFSDMIFKYNAPPIFFKTFIKQGVELLYPPQTKSVLVQDDVFNALEGMTELDNRLTDAMKVYSQNRIKEFDYEAFFELSYDEYKKCVDKDMTAAIKDIAHTSCDDADIAWRIYRNLRIYPNA